jgi:membrane protease YdiL (CAAX protease family)
LICLGGIVPGIVILYLWPIAKQEQTELSEILAMLNLKNVSFILFAIYASIVNPFLEESFWRGCFNSGALHPNVIDMLFAGYHALVVSPVLKAPFVLLVFLAMIFVGWFFRMLYRITGGLAIPLLTHIIADIAILFAIWRIMQ